MFENRTTRNGLFNFFYNIKQILYFGNRIVFGLGFCVAAGRRSDRFDQRRNSQVSVKNSKSQIIYPVK